LEAQLTIKKKVVVSYPSTVSTQIEGKKPQLTICDIFGNFQLVLLYISSRFYSEVFPGPMRHGLTVGTVTISRLLVGMYIPDLIVADMNVVGAGQ
jgi:hypothetical protein